MDTKPTAGYSATVRIEYPNTVGMLGKVTSAIGMAGGDLGSIDIVSIDRNLITRDINFYAAGTEHIHQIVKEIKKIPHITIKQVTDRIFAVHHGGKIETKIKYPINNRDDLSLVYTPGVARVCREIHENPKHVYNYTIKGNTIAIVTDGTAVLGLGEMGPLAALPVMEGKAMLFKEFAGINAFPICLDTKDPDEIVSIVKNISPVFGGINLEDISAPRCFEIEERLREGLDIPVFHDDQHGTAVVVLAALYNALKIVKKDLGEIKIAVSGAGAAGIACVKLLISAGANPKKIIIADNWGIIYEGRPDGMDKYKQELAAITNPKKVTGTIHDAVEGADVFLGVSVGGLLTRKDIIKMAKNPIVFALANPVPEISPEEAQPYARVVATGRSDYPNQINNVLCFPGFFRGLLNARVRRITRGMEIAAAQALASLIKPDELNEDYIIPSVLDRRVQLAVARAVERVAREEW
ncbi:NAD-dependent malic enzyme [Thermacetogenium phaeum DSM 12270]|uniref:NAD-dependent malic enzyme n=1 Tax=Thermacetogenium phaeum (strain ATCC BAA-254 / DSM 26808 / PB) TaxID=1089553 RepID=K4LHV0_THEPS|nr:NAD-dependent malic enzyme [Thermacetogenium phaeum]AFV11540.1 NAD-dependent malic enzyme [Thermacetogenium phaeum DSM 12270]